MNTLKFKQDFNSLAELIIYFIKKSYKNVYFEVKNNLNYLTTFNKFPQLEKIYTEFLNAKVLNVFFEQINKYILLNFHKNKAFCLELIKGLIYESFDIPLNNLINYLNAIFEIPEKDFLLEIIKIIPIKVCFF